MQEYVPMKMMNVGLLVLGFVSSVSTSVFGADNPDAGISPELADWRKNAAQTMTSQKGCFEVQQPDTTWREVPCSAVTSLAATGFLPNSPTTKTTTVNGLTSVGVESSTISPMGVGGGVSGFLVSVSNPTDVLTSMTGFFSEASDVWGISTSGEDNEYDLLLNTNTFSTAACQGSTNPYCTGWQQFGYDNHGYVFIQYWLLNYETVCPSGWGQYGNDCYRNSSNIAYVGSQPLSVFPSMVMKAEAGAAQDCLTFWYKGSGARICEDSVLGLNQQWKFSDYNIYGDGNGSTVDFIPGVTIAVGMMPTARTPSQAAAPYMCVSGSSPIAEWNNLTLVGDCCWDQSHFYFYESYYGTGHPTCPKNMNGSTCGTNSNCYSGSCWNGTCVSTAMVAPAMPLEGLFALALALGVVGLVKLRSRNRLT